MRQTEAMKDIPFPIQTPRDVFGPQKPTQKTKPDQEFGKLGFIIYLRIWRLIKGDSRDSQ